MVKAVEVQIKLAVSIYIGHCHLPAGLMARDGLHTPLYLTDVVLLRLLFLLSPVGILPLTHLD